MRANDAFHIAVLPGDGIGPEVMAPALEILRKLEATTPGLSFRFTEAPAGANHYRETGTALPESTVKLCEQADAILLGACGLPHIRHPDGTEIAPQVELRFIFDLYAGVRPARLIPGVPSPIVGAAERGIDLVVIRESTEGLFASMGKGIVTDHDARETMVPDGRPAWTPALPVAIDGARLDNRRDPPQIGEHTREVPAEIGYGHAEIAALAHSAVVGLRD